MQDTGAIMGRTPMSWLLITVFYIIYYTCLAGFWVACLYIFFQFVDDEKPRWEQENSLIGRSPALGVRPGQVSQDWWQKTCQFASLCSVVLTNILRYNEVFVCRTLR